MDEAEEMAQAYHDERMEYKAAWKKWNSLRPEVQLFAQEMEERLRANDHEAGWKRDGILALMSRLDEESTELWSCFNRVAAGKDVGVVEVKREAADVAIFAMRVADLYVGRNSGS